MGSAQYRIALLEHRLPAYLKDYSVRLVRALQLVDVFPAEVTRVVGLAHHEQRVLDGRQCNHAYAGRLRQVQHRALDDHAVANVDERAAAVYCLGNDAVLCHVPLLNPIPIRTAPGVGSAIRSAPPPRRAANSIASPTRPLGAQRPHALAVVASLARREAGLRLAAALLGLDEAAAACRADALRLPLDPEPAAAPLAAFGGVHAYVRDVLRAALA